MNGAEKVKARREAQRKIPLGMCEVESCAGFATDRHHPDHSKPLEVMKLCRAHHLEADENLLREKGREGAAKRWRGITRVRMCPKCGRRFNYVRAREKTCSRSCGNLLAWERRGGSGSQTSPVSPTA